MVPGLPVAARNIEASALLVMLGCYSLGGVLPSVASVRGAGPCSAMSVSPPWSCRGSLPQAAPTPPSSVLTLYRGSSSSLGDATLPYKGKHVDGDRRGEGAAMALTSPVTPRITAASPLPPLSSARHPRWPSADTPVAVQGPFPRFGLRRADLSPWGTASGVVVCERYSSHSEPCDSWWSGRSRVWGGVEHPPDCTLPPAANTRHVSRRCRVSLEGRPSPTTPLRNTCFQIHRYKVAPDLPSARFQDLKICHDAVSLNLNFLSFFPYQSGLSLLMTFSTNQTLVLFLYSLFL